MTSPTRNQRETSACVPLTFSFLFSPWGELIKWRYLHLGYIYPPQLPGFRKLPHRHVSPRGLDPEKLTMTINHHSNSTIETLWKQPLLCNHCNKKIHQFSTNKTTTAHSRVHRSNKKTGLMHDWLTTLWGQNLWMCRTVRQVQQIPAQWGVCYVLCLLGGLFVCYLTVLGNLNLYTRQTLYH